MGLSLPCYKPSHQIYSAEDYRENLDAKFNKTSEEGSQLARFSYSAFMTRLSRNGSHMPAQSRSESQADSSWLQASPEMRVNTPAEHDDSQFARYSRHSRIIARPVSIRRQSRGELAADSQWALRVSGYSPGFKPIDDPTDRSSPRNAKQSPRNFHVEPTNEEQTSEDFEL